MDEADKAGSAKALKGLIKKPDVPVSVDDMNDAIRLEACAGSTNYIAEVTDHAPSSAPGAPRS